MWMQGSQEVELLLIIVSVAGHKPENVSTMEIALQRTSLLFILIG